MSIYSPLQDVLRTRSGKCWKVSFTELERILRRPLPTSAYRYQAWWANQEGPGHSQTAAWRDVGWRTANLDLESQTVEFRKKDSAERDAVDAPGTSLTEKADISETLMARAETLLGTRDRPVIIQKALESLVAREAGRELIGLGGAMPGLEAPPRRRGEAE